MIAIVARDGPLPADDTGTPGPTIAEIRPAAEDSPFTANESDGDQEFLRTTLEVDVEDDDPTDALDIVWIDLRGNEPIGTGPSAEVRLSAGCPRFARHDIEVIVIDRDDNVPRGRTTVTVLRRFPKDSIAECIRIEVPTEATIRPVQPLDPGQVRRLPAEQPS
ncbi:MAG: hypothetical protein KY462_08940 [Actinobacteria bacterium]|nr:hypothetical protein [Actinomycetota bacterium]